MIVKFNLVLIFFVVGILNAQFISDLSDNSLPSNINEQIDNYPIFTKTLNRFNINHGFSMSMISDGKTFYSVSGIDNNFSYSFLDKISFNGNIGLYMIQSPLQKQNPLIDQLSVAYNASVIYKPTKNSFLQFRIQKIPHYQKHQNYSPFNLRFNQ